MTTQIKSYLTFAASQDRSASDTITDQIRVSGADDVIERAGLSGGYVTELEAKALAVSYGMHESALYFTSNMLVHNAPANTPGVTSAMNYCCINELYATKQTVLHEIAHAIDTTKRDYPPNAHAQPWRELVTAMYAEHLGAEAAAIFTDLTSTCS